MASLKSCLVCKKDYKVSPCELNSRKYCSLECVYINRKKNPIRYWLGKKRDIQMNRKISEKLKGRSLSEETKMKMKGRIVWNKGKKGLQKHTDAWKNQQSLRVRGENHWNWQGGKSDENERMRRVFDYYLWRKTVFKRDNYTCQICGSRKDLQADHIKSFSSYPELRYVISNGRTLCVECHRSTPNYGYKAKFEKEVVNYA